VHLNLVRSCETPSDPTRCPLPPWHPSRLCAVCTMPHNCVQSVLYLTTVCSLCCASRLCWLSCESVLVLAVSVSLFACILVTLAWFSLYLASKCSMLCPLSILAYSAATLVLSVEFRPLIGRDWLHALRLSPCECIHSRVILNLSFRINNLQSITIHYAMVL